MEKLRSPLPLVSSEQAPHASGPYSRSILADAAAGSRGFLSGSIALSPMTGPRVAGGDVRATTEQATKNQTAVRATAGCRSAPVVKTWHSLADRADCRTVRAIYRSARPARHHPARAAVQVADQPHGACTVVNAIAAQA